jgi:pseudaminic acid synthase
VSNPYIRIADRVIGSGEPSYLIAELSGNHNGSFDRALETIRAAARAGADAIKLQTYTADTLTIDSDSPDFVVPRGGPWGGRTLYELYEVAHTPWEWHPALFREARKLGLEIFSTPFDASAVELLQSLSSPAYKIASFELVDDELLRSVARTHKPILLSTGMATLEEIGHAVGVLRDAGALEVLLLRCTSSYPAPDDSMNLATIPALSAATGCPVGLSDHSLGVTAAVSAIALGACLVEKHFTLDRESGGVDSHFSLEPGEFQDLVTQVRRAEAMKGRPTFGPGVAEEGSTVFRRSLYVVADVEKGELLTNDNVRSIRPGYGLPPRFLDLVVGKRAARAVRRGTPVSWSLLTGE